MNGVHLVVFDCDGTLVDSQHIITTAMSRAFQLQGLAKPERTAVLGVVGLNLDEAIRVLAPSLDDATVALVEQDYKASFFDLRRDAGENALEPLYPGMDELVRNLDDSGHVLAVATGKSLRGLRHVLAGHDLTAHFATLRTPDTAPGKPHPGMILEAMAVTGADAGSTVMVGDATYDIQMARAAGVTALGVAWGYHPVAALEAAGAHRIAADAAELAAMIEEAFSEPGPA